jgi:hypothetical protein
VKIENQSDYRVCRRCEQAPALISDSVNPEYPADPVQNECYYVQLFEFNEN